MSDPEPTQPPLTESARAVYEAARTVASALGGNVSALRRLIAADLALARAAVVEGIVLLAAVAVLFGTAWALLTTLVVYGLHKAGVPWVFAMAVPLLVSSALGAVAAWRAKNAIRHADMDASRRQFTLWFGSLEEVAEAKQAPAGTLDAGAAPQPQKVDGAP